MANRFGKAAKACKGKRGRIYAACFKRNLKG
jgi:hypothetical protein